MTNKHYTYKGYRLQTSGSGNNWVCFINEIDPLLLRHDTEAEALAEAKRMVNRAKKLGPEWTEFFMRRET